MKNRVFFKILILLLCKFFIVNSVAVTYYQSVTYIKYVAKTGNTPAYHRLKQLTVTSTDSDYLASYDYLCHANDYKIYLYRSFTIDAGTLTNVFTNTNIPQNNNKYLKFILTDGSTGPTQQDGRNWVIWNIDIDNTIHSSNDLFDDSTQDKTLSGYVCKNKTLYYNIMFFHCYDDAKDFYDKLLDVNKILGINGSQPIYSRASANSLYASTSELENVFRIGAVPASCT